MSINIHKIIVFAKIIFEAFLWITALAVTFFVQNLLYHINLFIPLCDKFISFPSDSLYYAARISYIICEPYYVFSAFFTLMMERIRGI